MALQKRTTYRLALLGSAAVAVVAAAIPLACSIAVDLNGLSGGKPDAGTDGGGGGGGSPVVCTHARWPGPPASATEGGTIDFYAAVRSIDIGETKEDPSGFDLDNVCTCAPDGPSCAYPKYALGDHCDDADGRDNAVAKVFREIQLVAGESTIGSSVFSARAEFGRWSLLLRVSDYNGEADDAQVTLAMLETSWDDTDKTPQPVWDGTDLWPIAESSLIDTTSMDSPKYFDKAAYVAGNVLVASLPDAYLSVNGGGSNLGIKLTAGTISGRIEKVGDRYRISDGLIGARWKADDLFNVIGAFDVGGEAICNNGSPIYKRFKEVVCGNLDIASMLGGPTTPCDSLSLGMKFTTEPAGADKIFLPDEQESLCSKATDPANDTCDNL